MLKNLLDNDYSKYAFALATIGGLIADQFSSGYIASHSSSTTNQRTVTPSQLS